MRRKALRFSALRATGWSDFVHPDDLAHTRQQAKRWYVGQPFASENRYRHKDGSYRWLDWRVHGDREGETFYAVATDITERKRVEAALRESEEGFRSLIDNMSQLAWMADSWGSVFWFNQRWYAYTGTTLEENAGLGVA